MIRYVSLDAVLRANQRHGGDSGIRDHDLIEAAVRRPQAGFGDVEAHPTLWLKAAALLHGLVSTQGFHDGNKRTGWTVTTAFLRANGHTLPQLPPIQAEAFVMSVAVSAWSDRTVEKAAEWFEDLATGKSALDPGQLNLVLSFRVQPYVGIGLPPFVVVKLETATFDSLEQKPIERANLAISPDAVLELADLLTKVWHQVPKPGQPKAPGWPAGP